jgi:ferredoxin
MGAPVAGLLSAPAVVDVDGLDALIGILERDGWTVLGPTVRDGAVVPGVVHGVADLPRDVGVVQSPGSYRLTTREDGALFGWAGAAFSWKPVLFPSRQLLWGARRRVAGDPTAGFDVVTPDEPPPRRALLGVRACDLAAIAVHDRVLAQRWAGRPAVDPHYVAARAGTFVVAVACGEPAGTCFCASTGTGPEPGEGADLVLTELLDQAGHRFLVHAGSPAGAALLEQVPGRPAGPSDLQAADEVHAAARASITRHLGTGPLPALLEAEVEHPLWDEVAQRCLACGSCTAVCPTCFCTSVEDTTDLSGDATARWRVWDSCFSAQFSYVHGGPVRASTKARYRQWMSHKLGTWQAQLGTSGCVGCGRCLTWCPVGLDLTEQAAALQQTARSRTSRPLTEDGPPA